MSLSPSDLPELRALLQLQKTIASDKFSTGQMIGMMQSQRTGPWMRGIGQCWEHWAQFEQTRAMEPYFKNMVCLGGATCPDEMKGWVDCIQKAAHDGDDIGQCARMRKKLERCTRERAQQLLRASASELFKKAA